MSIESDVTVGLTEETHQTLQKLKDDGVFNEMRDAYRFGIAFAIARGRIAPEDIKIRTFINIGSLDPDGLIRNVVIELFPNAVNRPYKYAERLAEWGVSELGMLYENHNLKFSDIFKNLELTKP